MGDNKPKGEMEDLGTIVAGLIMGVGILLLIWGWIKYT